jgi:hypothetical protein
MFRDQYARPTGLVRMNQLPPQLVDQYLKPPTEIQRPSYSSDFDIQIYGVNGQPLFTLPLENYPRVNEVIPMNGKGYSFPDDPRLRSPISSYYAVSNQTPNF